MEKNGIRLQNKTGKTCKDKWTEVQPQPNGEKKAAGIEQTV